MDRSMIRGHTLSSVPPTSIFEVAGYFQAQSSKSTAGTPLNILNQKNIADCKTEGKAIKPISWHCLLGGPSLLADF